MPYRDGGISDGLGMFLIMGSSLFCALIGFGLGILVARSTDKTAARLLEQCLADGNKEYQCRVMLKGVVR